MHAQPLADDLVEIGGRAERLRNDVAERRIPYPKPSDKKAKYRPVILSEEGTIRCQKMPNDWSRACFLPPI